MRTHTTQVDSGVLATDRAGGVYGIPDSATRASYGVRFRGAAGKYHYLCQIHGGMEANIVVTNS